MKKILAVASIGGHWVQLLRITRPLEEHYEVVYMSTHPKCKSMVGTCRFHDGFQPLGCLENVAGFF